MNRDHIRSAPDALAYYTQCAIATYDISMETKKYSKADRQRFLNIAEGMLDMLKAYGDKSEYADAEDRLNKIKRSANGED